ncbi:hypothetical protein, conserved [Eimeria acervulina]|uniref:Uncharacterized protein n=1 Tax=Eimeria acervulina TaxID=5801 RepID=U6GXE2_EIMAC|nr:hypothetical protein, conserved [Eimeria acervulina]CDI84267.1 hypothetical protein, conserved [Eimeria acervulina]
MRALNMLCAHTNTHTKGASAHGHFRGTRELVLLDALTGEAFRFPWPLSLSGNASVRKLQRDQSSSPAPEACFWLNLEHYVNQLLPMLPPSLAAGSDSARKRSKDVEPQNKSASRLEEPQRCLCFVEATGRSLSAEAAAALQEPGSSSKNNSSLIQSSGPLSLILIRPELLSCLGSSCYYGPALAASAAEGTDGKYGATAAAEAVAPQLTSLSLAADPKVLSTVEVIHGKQIPTREPEMLSSSLPTYRAGDRAAGRGVGGVGAAVIAAAAATAALGGGANPDAACACSSADCFSFPSATVQQRLVSGELKALRSATLLDGDASFRVFGSNIVAAAPLLCASRDAAAVAADLHVRLRRQRSAAEVVVRALLRHADLALKWAEALKLRLQQQAIAQESVVAGFEQLLLKLQQTPVDPVLLLLLQLKHDNAVQQQHQPNADTTLLATASTELFSHRASPRTQDSAAAGVAAASEEVTAARQDTLRTAAADTKKTSFLTEAGSSAAGECSPADVGSGKGVWADAIHSAENVSDEFGTMQPSPAGLSAASCGSFASAAAATAARPSAAPPQTEVLSSLPGEQVPLKPCLLGSPAQGTCWLGLICSPKQRRKVGSPIADIKETESPAAVATTAPDSSLGKHVVHFCGSESPDGGPAPAAAVPAASACSGSDHSNPSTATLGTAAGAVQQQNSLTGVEAVNAPGAGATRFSFLEEPAGPTAEVEAGSTAAATAAAATLAADLATTEAASATAPCRDGTVIGPSVASLLNVPAIRAFATSVFADRTAVLQQVEQVEQDICAATTAFRCAADGLLAAAGETEAALSILLGEQQELTAVHTRAFAAVAAATPTPPVAYSRFAPQQLRLLAADQEAAMLELHQLEKQQKALTKKQRVAWMQHCRQQLQLLRFCLRGRLKLRQYHEQGLACSMKAQRVNGTLLQLRRLYACPAAFAGAARETIRRLTFAASFRKAAETARAVLHRMQQQEQQQRLQFLESAASSLPTAVFWPLLRVTPQEAHVTLPETDEPIISIIDPSVLAAALDESPQQQRGGEKDQQQRQKQEDRLLLRALLRSELARTRQHTGGDICAQRRQQRQRQQQQAQQQQQRGREEQHQLLRRANELLGEPAGPHVVLHDSEQQQQQQRQQRQQQQPAPPSVHRDTAAPPWKIQPSHSEMQHKREVAACEERSQQFTRPQQVKDQEAREQQQHNQRQQQKQQRQEQQQKQQQQCMGQASVPHPPEFLHPLEQLGHAQLPRQGLQDELLFPSFAAVDRFEEQQQQQHQQETQLLLLQQDVICGSQASSRPGSPWDPTTMQYPSEQPQLWRNQVKGPFSLQKQQSRLRAEQEPLLHQLLQQQLQQPRQPQQLQQLLQKRQVQQERRRKKERPGNDHREQASAYKYGVEAPNSSSQPSVYQRQHHTQAEVQQQQSQAQPVSDLQQHYLLQQARPHGTQFQAQKTQQHALQHESHWQEQQLMQPQQNQKLLQHQGLGPTKLPQQGWEVPVQPTPAASGQVLEQQSQKKEQQQRHLQQQQQPLHRRHLQQQQRQQQQLQQLYLQQQLAHQRLAGCFGEDEGQHSPLNYQQQQRQKLQEAQVQQHPGFAAGEPQQRRQMGQDALVLHNAAQLQHQMQQQEQQRLQQQQQQQSTGSEQQHLKQWIHPVESLHQQQQQQSLQLPPAAELLDQVHEERQLLVQPITSQREHLNAEQTLEKAAALPHQQEEDFVCHPTDLQQLQRLVRQDCAGLQFPIQQLRKQQLGDSHLLSDFAQLQLQGQRLLLQQQQQQQQLLLQQEHRLLQQLREQRLLQQHEQRVMEQQNLVRAEQEEEQQLQDGPEQHEQRLMKKLQQQQQMLEKQQLPTSEVQVPESWQLSPAPSSEHAEGTLLVAEAGDNSSEQQQQQLLRLRGMRASECLHQGAPAPHRQGESSAHEQRQVLQRQVLQQQVLQQQLLQQQVLQQERRSVPLSELGHDVLGSAQGLLLLPQQSQHQQEQQLQRGDRREEFWKAQQQPSAVTAALASAAADGECEVATAARVRTAPSPDSAPERSAQLIELPQFDAEDLGSLFGEGEVAAVAATTSYADSAGSVYGDVGRSCSNGDDSAEGQAADMAEVREAIGAAAETLASVQAAAPQRLEEADAAAAHTVRRSCLPESPGLTAAAAARPAARVRALEERGGKRNSF